MFGTFGMFGLFGIFGISNRFKNSHIARAATQISGQPFAQFRVGWMRMFVEQCFRRHNHAGRAITALCRAKMYECSLKWMGIVRAAQTCDGENFLSSREPREMETRIDRRAVH